MKTRDAPGRHGNVISPWRPETSILLHSKRPLLPVHPRGRWCEVEAPQLQQCRRPQRAVLVEPSTRRLSMLINDAAAEGNK